MKSITCKLTYLVAMGKYLSHMKRKQQLEFMGKAFIKPKAWFGGGLLKGNAKTKRPIDSKLPMHAILKSSKAIGKWSLRSPTNIRRVRQLVESTCAKYGISLLQYANAGNHFHLLIQVKNRRLWPAFIRELSGEIARIVCGTHAHSGLGQKFWDSRPFTRIVAGWGKPYSIVRDYVAINQLEAVGVLTKFDRGKWFRLENS
jgi:putative transposase